jgi:Tfp pilus assembly protein PilF
MALSVLWLARCFNAEGNADEAAQTYERVASMKNCPEPTRSEAFLEAASAYEKLKRPEKTLSVFEQGERELRNEAMLAELHTSHGEYLVRLKKPGEALAQFSRAIEIAASSDAADRARVASANIKVGFQDFPAARLFAERVASSRTDALGAEAQVVVGRALLGQKDYTNAISALLRVRYVFAAHERWIGESYLDLGEVYEQQHEIPKAKDAYRAAAKMKNQKSVAAEAERRVALLERK